MNFKVCYDCNNRLDYVLFLLSNCPITIENTENGLLHFHGIKDFVENKSQISYKGGLASFSNLTSEQQQQFLNKYITIFNHE